MATAAKAGIMRELPATCSSQASRLQHHSQPAEEIENDKAQVLGLPVQ